MYTLSIWLPGNYLIFSTGPVLQRKGQNGTDMIEAVVVGQVTAIVVTELVDSFEKEVIIWLLPGQEDL